MTARRKAFSFGNVEAVLLGNHFHSSVPLCSLPCESFGEAGVGKGVSGKIGKNLFTHVNPSGIGPSRWKSASVTSFGIGTKVIFGMVCELIVGNPALFLMQGLMVGHLDKSMSWAIHSREDRLSRCRVAKKSSTVRLPIWNM
ncbi:MAG: hypothetical protein QM771_16115 [Nitrospira sp.]